jgi:hypothetical protein
MISEVKNNPSAAGERVGEHETKFALPNHRSTVVRSWLNKRCEPDAEYAEGIISSIYFDTRQFDLLAEKLNSYYLKTKVRLRWYSSVKSGARMPAAFLEVKYKIGSARVKKRIDMEFTSDMVAAKSLEDPWFLRIHRLVEEQGVQLPGMLIPAMQITYRRSRYIDLLSGARLSVDSDIHAPRVNRRMISRANAGILDAAVFEYKENTGILPDWLSQVIALGDCRKCSFSKYSECYANVQQITY